MTQGLQVFNGSGVCTFDSNVAVGGVCLGFYTIPAAGTTLTFPSMAGATGGVVLHRGGGKADYTIDVTLGYPRFTFPAFIYSVEVVLFVL